MISGIRIKNFQSWESAEIELSTGLNVFIGSGDSGKTSMASRAIRWVQENRIRAASNAPMGDNYVSKWAKKTSPKGAVTLLDDCEVNITRPDGSYCRRFREAPKEKNGKEVNGYDLNGERFEAIGVGVPEAVSKWFGWSDVNIQKQHDQAFLISKGSGEVASFLNKTVRLDDIDAHITAAASLLRAEKVNLDRLREDQEADSKALEALAWVEGASTRLEALEALESSRNDKEAMAARLRELILQMEAAKIRMDRASKLLGLESRAKSLRREYDWCRGLQEKAHGYRELSYRWEVEHGNVSRTGRLAQLWPRVQALRDLRAQWVGEDTAAGYIRGMVSRWSDASMGVEASGKLVALASRVTGIRELWVDTQEAESRKAGIRELVRRWPVVRPVDWEDLDARVRRVRALVRGVDSRESTLQGIRKYILTSGALEATILETGKRVSELEAKRPESCPVCGGAMHKDGKHG